VHNSFAARVIRDWVLYFVKAALGSQCSRNSDAENLSDREKPLRHFWIVAEASLRICWQRREAEKKLKKVLASAIVL